MSKTIIEKVAEMMHEYSDIYDEQLARIAIITMRDLIKCDPKGNKQDSDILNEYIDRALK